MGNVRAARTQFEEVVRLAPNYGLAHLNLGVALFKEGQFEPATKQFEEAQRLNPKDALAPRYLEQLKAMQSTNGNPKAEIRNPKEGRNPKPEGTNNEATN